LSGWKCDLKQTENNSKLEKQEWKRIPEDSASKREMVKRKSVM
jgi:hypothetical protein